MGPDLKRPTTFTGQSKSDRLDARAEDGRIDARHARAAEEREMYESMAKAVQKSAKVYRDLGQ